MSVETAERSKTELPPGHEDGRCHIVETPRRALCGFVFSPPLRPGDMHGGDQGVCGHPPCLRCKQIAGE